MQSNYADKQQTILNLNLDKSHVISNNWFIDDTLHVNGRKLLVDIIHVA